MKSPVRNLTHRRWNDSNILCRWLLSIHVSLPNSNCWHTIAWYTDTTSLIFLVRSWDSNRCNRPQVRSAFSKLRCIASLSTSSSVTHRPNYLNSCTCSISTSNTLNFTSVAIVWFCLYACSISARSANFWHTFVCWCFSPTSSAYVSDLFKLVILV